MATITTYQLELEKALLGIYKKRASDNDPNSSPSAIMQSVASETSLAIAKCIDGVITGVTLEDIDVSSLAINFSNIRNTPTTLLGYGITDALGLATFEEHTNNGRHLTDLQKDILDLFSIVDGKLQVSSDFYSTGEVSAFGAGSGGSGGGGIIQTVYGISGLSATYSDANLTETFNAATIKKIYDDVVALQGGSLVNYSLTGTGNAITGVSKSGSSLNFVKGSTFSLNGHTHSFGDINGLPTTLSGYGITDGVTTTVFNTLANDFNTHVNSDVHLTATQKNILAHLQIVNGKLQADIDFYSTGEVSAFGAGSGGSSGGGLIQTVYGYSSLGNSFNNATLTDTFNAYTINQLHTRLSQVEVGAAVNVAVSGAGNAITSVAKNGNVLEFTKGTTFSLVGHTHDYIPLSQKGTANGVASLDANGLIISAQLPSYVDDVIEVSSYANLPTVGESGKIYVTIDTNITYRWTGTTYVEISKSLALGETSSTAYRGDLGAIAYAHSQIAGGTGVHVSATERTNWNTAYTNSHTHANKSLLDDFSQSDNDVLNHLSIVDGKLKVDIDLYSLGEVSAFGAGAGSGGSGLIQTVYGYSGLGGTYNDVTLTDTFNAYTINKINSDLNSRITSLESGSALTFTTVGSGNAVTSVTKSGTSVTVTKGLTFSVDGHTHTFDSLTNKPSTLGGYGITDGVKNNGGLWNISIKGRDNTVGNALLQSGAGRSDDESGSTWLFWDTLGGSSAPWGIRHNQFDNYIEYYGAGLRKAYIDLNNGYIYTNGKANTGDQDLRNLSTYSYVDNTFLKLAGGTMTGGISYSTTPGNDKTNNYISLGGGYSNGSGKYGLKVLTVEQPDAVMGMGADLGGSPYTSCITFTKSGTNGGIDFVYNTATNFSAYTRVGRIDQAGNLSVSGNATATNYLRSDGATIWHSGNDGEGSGLDADMLDGRGGVGYIKSYGFHETAGLDFNTIDLVGSNDGFCARCESDVLNPPITGVYNWSLWQQGNKYRGSQIAIHAYNLGTGMYVRSSSLNDNAWNNWRKVAFEDSNVESATKLETARTLWGQYFDGSGNVSGTFTSGIISIGDTNEIWSTGAPLYINHSTRGGQNVYMCTGNGNVGIGTNVAAYKLDVAGTLRATGAVTLDSTLSVNNITNFHNAVNLNGSSINVISPNTTGGWARGMFFSTYANPSTTIGGVGAFGSSSNFESVYFGAGSSPWAYGSLRISTSRADIDLPLYGASFITGSRIFTGFDSGVANSISCSNWFRSNGATGWYNDTYAGGITMTDSTYVRVFNNKAFWVDNNIVATGEITAFGASDIRLKSNIKQIDSALDFLCRVKTYEFDWNEKAIELNPLKTKRGAGVIAQEMNLLDNNFVHSIYGDYLGVDYERFIPYLIGGVNEVAHKTISLGKRLDDTDSEIDKLKLRISELENKLSYYERN